MRTAENNHHLDTQMVDDSTIAEVTKTLSLSDNMVENIHYHDPSHINLGYLGKYRYFIAINIR
jgi:hypothetical protein